MERFTQPVEGQNDGQETTATHGGLHAATNKNEYWAEAVARHFRPQAGESVLVEKDPAAAALVASVFGDAKISFCP